MKQRVLCLYLPSSNAGLRTLTQIHDTATLALTHAPTEPDDLDAVLIALRSSGQGPRSATEAWQDNQLGVYLAVTVSEPYTGEALLNGEEQRLGRILYPWRVGVRTLEQADGVSAGYLPDALSNALRQSGITGHAEIAALNGPPLRTLIESAGSGALQPAWDLGAAFREARTLRQPRGTAGRSPAAQERDLLTHAQREVRHHLEQLGWTHTGEGPSGASATYRDPDGRTVHAHVHASIGSATILPLTRTERRWHQDAPSLLGVVRDAQRGTDGYSGGQVTVLHDWRIDDTDLRPSTFLHTPGEPTEEILLD